jgi:hypothetical protein
MGVSLAFAAAAGGAPQDPAPKAHVGFELTLAGLRPGKDDFAAAEKRYKSKLLRTRAKSDEGKAKTEDGKEKPAENRKDKPDEVREWLDDCHGRSLRVAVDAKGTILSVTISAIAPTDGDCKDKSGDFLNWRNWMTGRGLRLGDPRDRIIELYGEPDSDGPSVKGTRELELLYYAFDWAGSDVPQVMEVSCERSTGKVLEITLAFPSL